MRVLISTLLLAASPAAAQQAALPGAAPRPTTSQAPGPVAKRAPINGVLVLYGNERCPTDADGNEVVVCSRRGAEEQYRVPKELREFEVTPQNQSWAARAEATTDTGVGANSIGSCSAVGPGGQTGCIVQRNRQWKREQRAAKAAESAVP